MTSNNSAGHSADDLRVNSNFSSTQENTDELNQRDGIFERDDKKLAFVHHKKEVVISNFTTKVESYFEASNVAGYIFAISSNDRTWQCALTLGQLCDSRVVLGILQNHCRDALWYRVPRDAPSNVDLGEYMFRQTDEFRVSGGGHRRQVATIYPAWQSCGTFVVSNDLQINAKTRTCLPVEERYIIYERSWTKNRGKGASADDINVSVAIKQPFSQDGIKNLLVAFKGLLCNNYPAACLALGGTIMSLGYQRIIQAGGSCPVVLLTGDTETSKTTVLKACLSITGNSEAKDFTAKKALERSKKCDIPYAWDDPSSKDDVKFIVQALFNQAGKDTVHSSGYPRTPPIISANFACANDKRIFSRQAIIIFERPNPQHTSQIMAVKKAALDLAAKEASTGFLEALCLVENFLDPSSEEERTLIADRIEKMFPGRIRSPAIYSKVMWFTYKIMKVSKLEDDLALIWEYLEYKVAPFILDLFSGVQDSSSLISQDSASSSRTVWDILADVKHPLSKKQANTAYKTTFIRGRDCLAIAYDVASTFLRNATEGKSLLSQLKDLPNSIKGRIHFLSPDSDTDYLKMSKGRDVHGKSVLRQCVSIPLLEVPEKLLQVLRAANVMKDLPPSSSTTSPARNDAMMTSADQTSANQALEDQTSANQALEDQTCTNQALEDQTCTNQASTDQASADDLKLVAALDEVETSFTMDSQADDTAVEEESTVPISGGSIIVDEENEGVGNGVSGGSVIAEEENEGDDIIVISVKENEGDKEDNCVPPGRKIASPRQASSSKSDDEKSALDEEIVARAAEQAEAEAKRQKGRKGGRKKVSNLFDDLHPGTISGKRRRMDKR